MRTITTTALATVFCFALTAVLPNSAQAVMLTSEADSWIEGLAATTNFGTLSTMEAKNQSGGLSGSRKSYVRFDLSSLTQSIDSASLSLEFLDLGGGAGGTTTNWEFEVYGLDDGDAGENWGETTINWNNAPANDTADNGLLSNATSLGTFAFVGRTQSVDFYGSSGTAVRDFLNQSTSDDLATFIIVRNTPQPDGSNSYIHTMVTRDDGVNTSLHPQLDLELAVPQVPEPSSLMLLGLAALGLVRHTRRRGNSKH